MKLQTEKNLNAAKSKYLKFSSKKIIFLTTVYAATLMTSCKKVINEPAIVALPDAKNIEAKDYQKVMSIVSHILDIKCKLKNLSITDFFTIKISTPDVETARDSYTQQILPDGDTVKVLTDYDENLQRINGRSLIYCFSGNTDHNGVVMEGRITYRINGEKFFLDSGMSCNVIIENLRINADKANGVITIENKGESSYSINTQHFKVIIDAKEVEIVDGLFTKIDNENCHYKLAGHASVISSLGNPFRAIITDTLVVDSECKWKLVSGAVELDVQSQSPKQVDFGNGDCDPFATIKINDQKIPILF